MLRRTRVPKTVLDLMVNELRSLPKVQRLGTFIATWAVVELAAEHGEIPLPTGRVRPDEYAEYWNVNRSTAYANLTLFHQVWPNFETPGGLLLVMRANGATGSGLADLKRTPLSAVRV